jgi:hypothetical protein
VKSGGCRQYSVSGAGAAGRISETAAGETHPSKPAFRRCSWSWKAPHAVGEERNISFAFDLCTTCTTSLSPTPPPWRAAPLPRRPNQSHAAVAAACPSRARAWEENLKARAGRRCTTARAPETVQVSLSLHQAEDPAIHRRSLPHLCFLGVIAYYAQANLRRVVA